MNFNPVIWAVFAIALQGFRYYQAYGVARLWGTEGIWDETGSTNHTVSSAIQGQLCGLKQRGSITITLEDSQKASTSQDWAWSPLLLSVFL